MPPLRGEPIADDVQLDGSRHLTIVAVDLDRAWVAEIHLVIDEERALREGEVSVEGPDATWSGALEDVLDFETRGYLRLRALFGDPDGLEEPVVVEAEEDEAGTYHVLIAPD